MECTKSEVLNNFSKIAAKYNVQLTPQQTVMLDKGIDISIKVGENYQKYVSEISEPVLLDNTNIKEKYPVFSTLPKYIPGQQNMTYAGVGSRSTPEHMLKQMTEYASYLESKGYTLQTGMSYNAKKEGADQAFDIGVIDDNNKRIYSPESDGTDKIVQDIAKEVHPIHNKLKPFELKLHARNTHQVFGDELDTPVDFVLAWTPDGKATGGTGQAIRLANIKGIPVINMYESDWKEQLNKIINKEIVEPVSVNKQIEISSNSKELEGELTNRTELAKQKNNIDKSYPITYNGKKYKDVEAAYQANKDTTESKTKPSQNKSKNYKLMVELITNKLNTYPALMVAIDKKGGIAYLNQITHQPTKQNSVWETGGQNWFKKALIESYENVTNKQKPKMSQKQIDKLNAIETVKTETNSEPVSNNTGSKIKEFANYANTIIEAIKQNKKIDIKLNLGMATEYMKDNKSLAGYAYVDTNTIKYPDFNALLKDNNALKNIMKFNSNKQNKYKNETKEQLKKRIVETRDSLEFQTTNIHEHIHIAAMKFMKDNPKDINTIYVTKLYDKVQQFAKDNPKHDVNKIQNGYWKTNVDEFLAVSLSNPDMIKFLSETNFKMNAVEPEAINSNLSQLVKRLLNMIGFTGNGVYELLLTSLLNINELSKTTLDTGSKEIKSEPVFEKTKDTGSQINDTVPWKEVEKEPVKGKNKNKKEPVSNNIENKILAEKDNITLFNGRWNELDVIYTGRIIKLAKYATSRGMTLVENFGNPFVPEGVKSDAKLAKIIPDSTNESVTINYYNWLNTGVLPNGYNATVDETKALEKRRKWIFLQLDSIVKASNESPSKLSYNGTSKGGEINHTMALLAYAKEQKGNAIKSEPVVVKKQEITINELDNLPWDNTKSNGIDINMNQDTKDIMKEIKVLKEGC